MKHFAPRRRDQIGERSLCRRTAMTQYFHLQYDQDRFGSLARKVPTGVQIVRSLIPSLASVALNLDPTTGGGQRHIKLSNLEDSQRQFSLWRISIAKADWFQFALFTRERTGGRKHETPELGPAGTWGASAEQVWYWYCAGRHREVCIF